MASQSTALEPIEAWFRHKGWRPLPFQRQCWKAYLRGENGLIQVPTGAGKTYAAVMGPIAAMLANPGAGLRLLYLTPLRALSRDLALAIREPIETMGWPLTLGIRNGDTASGERSRQLRQPPQILISTPESLSVLLANRAAPQLFAGLEAVVLDEWHELMGSKRGSQTELALSWLRGQRPGLRTWAISATIGNLKEAAYAAVGVGAGEDPLLVCARVKRHTEIRSLLPESIDGFPWGGHLGLRMYEELVAALDPAISTLLFTNTRNQSERWHQCLRYACPEMEGSLALHHGSIDRTEREAIEAGVKSGAVRWVVCTSSLDLGVDFQPVERVVQIGSAKNLARLLQRAGRSAHNPGGTSQVLFMPTNALELLEVSAMRRGLAEGLVETRRPPVAPLDVLLQHLTSLACGPGFEPERELERVRSAWSYRHLDGASWQWCLRFLEHGGDCLGAYPRFRKLELEEPPGAVPGTGAPVLFRVKDPVIARLHRLGIGTITSSSSISVKVVRGATLGHVEEGFVSRLKPGDVFFFAGRQLEFVRLRDMTALVKASTRKSRTVPAWAGGQMALSDLLSVHLRREVHRCAGAIQAGDPAEAAADGADEKGLDTAELRALEPLLRRQADLSRLPREDQFLVEVTRSREGSHLFAYPFEGRFVHEGLGFLWAGRLTRIQSATITVSVNDYGFELLAPRGYPFEALYEDWSDALLDQAGLEADLEASINLSELCRRRFRSIAQIAGLVVNGFPGQKKSGGQLQISAALLFDVFSRHEPGNLLLEQARREVMDEQLELGRLRQALERLSRAQRMLVRTPRPGPFAFPLLVERLNNRMSSESVLERVQRLVAEARKAEDDG